MNKATALPAALCAAAALAFGIAQAQTRPTPEVRKANLTADQVASIQKILADAKPDTYNFSYAKDGREVSRAGSASMRDLSTVKAFSRTGAGESKMGNEALTTVSNYVKTVWTSKFTQMYPEKVRQINAILEKSAAM